MTSFWRPTLSGTLAPDDEVAERIMRRARPDDIIEADVKIPRDQRSIKQHNMYFKMLAMVFHHLPEQYDNEIPTPHHLRMRIFFAIGFTETIVTGKGVQEIPRSIQHAKLGQAEFHEKVWEPTIRLIETKLIPGIDRRELEREYYDLMGVAA